VPWQPLLDARAGVIQFPETAWLKHIEPR
jgi:hypothetical protein